MSDDNFILLARGLTTAPATGEKNVTKPGSGSTITLWENYVNNPSTRSGVRYKRIVLWVNSSHDSAASGILYKEKLSADGTYRTVATSSYTATDGVTRYFFTPAAPFQQITYQNSANVLTTWEMAVLGDPEERAV